MPVGIHSSIKITDKSPAKRPPTAERKKNAIKWYMLRSILAFRCLRNVCFIVIFIECFK